MKLKHVLFSSLFLSAALVACTNDEFAEMQAPSVNTEDAISLGEGFTISGTKVAMDPATKSFFEEGASGISMNWEKEDILGAAWFSAIKEGGIRPDGYVFDNAVKLANSEGKFAWNVDFNLDRFVGDDQTSAYFTANTNVSAGAYVVYSPWNEKISQEFGAIPVELAFPYTVNLAEGHEYDAVSENMFSYGVAAFVPGGRQTDKFNLKQVPVLYGLQLGIDNLKLVDLDNLQTIDRIVIEAYDKDNYTVLTTAGKVKRPERDWTVRTYNDYIDFVADNTNSWEDFENKFPQAVYSGVEKAKVNHYTIVLENSDQTKYQISTLKDQLTDRIVFSSLPIMGEATKLVVKVITDKDITLVKTFDPNVGTNEEKALAIQTLAAFNNAQNEGAMVSLKVRVDSQSKDNIIYTAGQFQEQWNAAVNATSNAQKKLVVADPVILKDITLECSNPLANVLIELDGSEVNAALSLKGINITGGSVAINCPVNVEGDINSSANLDIKGAIKAKNIILNGNSNTMNVLAMESLLVKESGDVTLELPENDYDATNIGKITVYTRGELNVSKGCMNDDVFIYTGGVFEISGTVTNLKSFDGQVTTSGSGKFINGANATASLNTESEVLVENKGILNIRYGSHDTFVNGSVNEGTINVQLGDVDLSKLTQSKAGAQINVEERAKVSGNTRSTITAGWVVVKTTASYDTDASIDPKYSAFLVDSAADFKKQGDVVNYFLTADVLGNVADWGNGNLYIYADQTIKQDIAVSNNVTIVGDVKFSTVDPEVPVTYTQNTGVLSVKDGSLYLNEGVYLTKTNGSVDPKTNKFIDAFDREEQVVPAL